MSDSYYVREMMSMNKQLFTLLLIILFLITTVRAQLAFEPSEKIISPSIFNSNIFACNLIVDAGNDTLICGDDFPIQLNGSYAGDAVNYYWSPSSNVSDSSILNPLANSPGIYTLTVESIDDENLVDNGDFENGDTGFTTDYGTGTQNVGNYLISDTPQDYFNLFSDCGDHTTGTGNMMIVDGSDIPNQNIWCQTINISPNTAYYFSLWATMVGGTNPPELFYTVDGNVISDTMSIPFDNCLWTELSQIWNSGTSTSIEFCIINNNISPFGNDFAIDDIFVAPICEVTDEMVISILEAEAIAPNETITCIGDCIMLDGSSSTSGPGVAHEWVSVTGGAIQNGSTLTPTVCDTGIYKLIITSLDIPTGLYCYDSTLVVVDLAIVSPSNPTFTGLDTICTGDSTSYQVSLPDPNTTNYDWFVTNGTILNGQDSTIVEVEWNGTSGGEICVSAINSCAISDTICLSILINSLPTEPIISGPTNVCNTTITNYSIPLTSNITNYQWTTPVGTMIQSGQGTEMIELDWGSVQGGDVCLVVENNCGADSSCISVVFGSIQINIDSLNPLCPSDNNGWIKVTPLAGTAPFSFIWGNGEVVDSIGGLPAGTYEVTVSDSDGCLTEEIIILQDPPPLNLNFSNTEITCHGNCDGIISAEVTGGTAPYDFLWGSNLGTNDSLLNVCEGIYNITITDVNGCTIEGQTQLHNPPLISATISNDTIICQGENVDIVFQFSGVGPFEVELSDGSSHPDLVDGDVISISPSATTIISITGLIDQGQPNCVASSASTISVTVNNPPALPILTGIDSTCQNTILNYCITNTATVDSFYWTIPMDASFTGQNSDCIEIDWGNSTGGQVCVEAINECGSTQECMDVIAIPISTSTFSVDPIICIDSTSTISYTGSASTNAIFTWNFDGGTIVSGNGSGPYEINWTTGGSYNITLTVEENGCFSLENSESVAVENPIPSPVINCTSTISSVTFSWDDVNGASSYQVNDLSGNGGMIIGNMYTVSGLANGEEVIIEVIASGNNACGSTTVQASCSADNCPTIDVMIDHVDPICLTPTSPPFTITATTSGGTNLGNMTWSGNGITDSSTGLFDPNIAGVGVHDITVGYEESNCFYLDVVTIQIFETPTADFSVDDLICTNDNSTITYLGSGTSNASYVWFFDGGTILSGNGAGSYELNWATAGNYNITLTVEENGCQSDVFSQTVQVDEILEMPTIICQSTTQSITFSWDEIVGATGYIINELSGINGTQIGNSVVYNNLNPGQEISLEVTAVGNTICGNSISTETCFANDCPLIDLIISPIDDICLSNFSPEIPLLVTVNGTDGSGMGSWSGSGIVNDIFDPNLAGEGQHELTYSFTELQCDFSESIIVNVFSQPIAAAGDNRHLDCEVTSVILDGNNSVVFGNLIWSTSTGNFINGINTLTPEIDAPGVYYLSIENSGCSSIDSVVVTQNIISPVADAGSEQAITCSQTCVDLGGDNTSIGNNFIYSWTSSNGFVSAEISPEVCQAGEYFLTVLDTINNCISATSNVTILENNTIPISQIEPIGNLDCNNTSLVLDSGNSSVGNQIEYQWFDEDGLLIGEINSTLEATEQGFYYLSVLDNLTGCFSSDTVFLSDVTSFPIAEVATPEILTCINLEVILDASNSSSSASIIYGWTTTTVGGIQSGQNTNQPMVTEPGIYEITVLDTLNGCETTASITVVQNIISPVADAGDEQAITCNQTCVNLGGNNTSIGNNFIYSWTSSNGFVSAEISPEVCQAGEYFLTVLDTVNNCISSTSNVMILENNTPPISQIEPIGNLDCNNTSLVLDGSNSAVGNQIEYQWFDEDGLLVGETNSTLEATEQGIYYLSVLDNLTGCFSSDTVFLNDNTSFPIAEIATPEILTCINLEVILDASNSSSSASIIYDWITTMAGGIQSGENTNQPIVTEPGIYEITVLDTLNGCETTASITVVQNITSPNADAGFDIQLECNETEAMLGSENTSSGTNFEYLWTSSNPNVIINSPTDLNPMVDGLGTYNLLVTNLENGCTASDEMQVSQSPNIPQNINLEILESPCYGDEQGMIMIPSIEGGTPPYLYSLNGDPFSSTNIYNNLQVGNYEILIQDANGCELSTMVTMSQPDSLSIDLGENIYLELGDSVMLNPLMTGVFDTIIWESSATYSNCDTLENCYDPIVTPIQTTNMMATLLNDDGCIAMDQITIFVEKNRYVYIPNAFSPDGYSDNQIFMIYAGKGVEKINTFKIFSRWGEQLFEAKDFYPNDKSYGWDGNYNGEKMNSGVYVYFAELEFSDGVKIIYKGDITLMR